MEATLLNDYSSSSGVSALEVELSSSSLYLSKDLCFYFYYFLAFLFMDEEEEWDDYDDWSSDSLSLLLLDTD